MKLMIACVLSAAMSTLAYGKEVQIAIDATSPPFESVAADGSLQGFDIDLMNALCARAKENCKLISAEWNGMIPGLISGKYDALISALNITEERKTRFNFTSPYMYTRFSFVGPKGEAQDTSFLKGKTIGVQQGTPQDAFVTKKFSDIATIKRYQTGSAPFLDLTSGRVDYVFNMQIQIEQTFLNSPENSAKFGLIGPAYASGQAPELGEGVAIAVSKKNAELLAKLNKALAEMKEDGSFKTLNDKYFAYDISSLPKN